MSGFKHKAEAEGQLRVKSIHDESRNPLKDGDHKHVRRGCQKFIAGSRTLL